MHRPISWTTSTNLHNHTPSSFLKKYQEATKAKALTILSGGVGTLDSLQVAYADNFSYPSLSAASAAFAAIDVTTTSNAAVSKAVMTTLDAVDSMSQDAQSLEIFLNLHIPKMEDGNNFGVTVRE
jgi:Proteasome activator pa28 beta subunit